jgi:hypothetical protein
MNKIGNKLISSGEIFCSALPRLGSMNIVMYVYAWKCQYPNPDQYISQQINKDEIAEEA